MTTQFPGWCQCGHHHDRHRNPVKAGELLRPNGGMRADTDIHICGVQGCGCIKFTIDGAKLVTKTRAA